MARSRSRSRSQSRGVRGTATPRVRLSPITNPFSRSPSSYLSDLEDRRRFHPAPYVPARTLDSSNHRLRASYSSPWAVAFQQPRRVLVCVRRKMRRQVMFAKGGAGRKRMRKPRYSEFSNVRC